MKRSCLILPLLLITGCQGLLFGNRVQPDVEAAAGRITPDLRSQCSDATTEDQVIAELIAALEADRANGLSRDEAANVFENGCDGDAPCLSCGQAVTALVFDSGS